jgi:hypothetical protein
MCYQLRYQCCDFPDHWVARLSIVKLGDNTLHFKSETPHLGLTRSSSDENRINIEERIALARRTLYSLIKTGVHGTNGLRHSCLLCSSADIGNVPNNRYTTELAVLIGRDCRRFSVPIGHHKGKNANRNIHATNTKEQVQPVWGGSNLPNMQTGNRNHNSRYYMYGVT